MIQTVESQSSIFKALFTLHERLSAAKRVVVRKLAQASTISTFVEVDGDLRVTGPEGFVAVSHDGQAVKLVDRLEFSRLNFHRWQ